MREMNEPVTIHRMAWECAICVEGLDRFGLVRLDAQAIAVGAGFPSFYFANRVGRMVATDLYEKPQHEGTSAMLADPGSFAPFPYRADHLQVLRIPGDRLDSQTESSTLLSAYRRSLAEMTRVVRPGGLLCIITKLILTDRSDDEHFRRV